MNKGQAERLLPLVEELFDRSGQTPKDLSAITVATGPGNFTGVRIGVSAARGLGLALGLPVVGVSILETIARTYESSCLVTADARGDQLYWQVFESGEPVTKPSVGRIEEIELRVSDVDVCAGFRASDIAERIGGSVGHSHDVTPSDLAAIAQHRMTRDAPPAAPLYIRPADAALPSRPAPRVLA